MSHPRTAIRNYVISKLESAALVPADGVSKEWVHPGAADLSQSIEVRTPSDQVAGRFSTAPLVLRRNLTLEVVVRCKGADAEDAANTIAESVEQLLMVDHTLGDLCNECVLDSTTVEQEAAEQRVAEAAITFAVEYASEHSTTATDDFTGADVDWDMGPEPDGQIDAQDTVDV